jgi:hypothetical protein
LVEQGAAGREIYIVLDGLLAVELDGQVISDVGPGAFVGELAALEHDVMLVSVVPAHLHDRPRLAAALATVLGVDPMRIAAKFEPAAVRSQRGGDCGGDSRHAVPAGRAAVARGRGPGV